MTTLFRCSLAMIAVGLSPSAMAAEKLEAPTGPTTFVSLSVYPPTVSLNHAEDFQQVVAVAHRADGITLDVTELADWQIDSQTANEQSFIYSENRVYATQDGEGQLTAHFAGLQARVSLVAEGVAEKQPLSFRHDVVPVFMRAGCNAGGCHGSSLGKDGFRLSLFGFDPAGDYHRLTREEPMRRLNLAVPEESLVLLKALGEVPHSGGTRFGPDSEYYRSIHGWIAAGAATDVTDAPSVDALAVYPPSAALPTDGKKQRFIAVASYSDGSTRDVSHLAVFQSNNGVSAAVDPDGVVTSGKKGEAFVMARFDTHTVGSQVLVMPTGLPFEPSREPRTNYIDQLVGEKLDTLRIQPSGICTDEEFLRRGFDRHRGAASFSCRAAVVPSRHRLGQAVGVDRQTAG